MATICPTEMRNNPVHDNVQSADLMKTTTPVVYTGGIRCPMLVNYEEAGGGGSGGTTAHGHIT